MIRAIVSAAVTHGDRRGESQTASNKLEQATAGYYHARASKQNWFGAAAGCNRTSTSLNPVSRPTC